VGNKTDGTTEDEKTVENAHPEVILGFLCAESTAVTEKVNKADGNATVNIQDKVIFLGGGDGLNGNGVIEELARREVGLDELLDELDTEIRIVAGLNSVTNAGNYAIIRPLAD